MFLPLAAVLLLSLLWTVYWILASDFVKSRFAEERYRLAANGLMLACTQEVWGGFPFRFEFSCGSPVVKLGSQTEIISSRLLLTALAYAPWQIVALVDGPSAFTGNHIGKRTVEHQRAMAALTLDRDRKVRFSAEIPELSVAGHGGAEQIMLHARPSAEGLVDVAASAKRISFQQAGKPTLSIAEGEFLGTLMPDRSLKIAHLELRQNMIRYWGAGALTLDSENRLSGKLETQTNDFDALLTLLDPHLALTEDGKAGLRSVLALLGNEAKATLIARDGVLYLGPFRLTDLQPLY
jgi:hypothetical protein